MNEVFWPVVRLNLIKDFAKHRFRPAQEFFNEISHWWTPFSYIFLITALKTK